jgi:hypothetical protein
MSRSTDPVDRKVPVTAELGDEGGSEGDAALQPFAALSIGRN